MSLQLFHQVVTGTSLVYEAPYVADFNARIRIMYQNGTTAKKFFEFTETVGLAGLSRGITQENDDIYIANGIDGQAITNIIIDDANLLVNVST